MEGNAIDWLSLAIRWIHVFTGILWIGTTYYFTWLDHRITEAEQAAKAGGGPGQVWMVHSGGFYVVEKRKVPELRSQTLHWFRYEALITWISGMLMLTIVYYFGAALVDPGKTSLSHGEAVGIGLGVLALSWFVYDQLCLSPIGANGPLMAAVSYGLVVALAYGLDQVFSGRAAYIHVGAVFGTLMAANVWLRILPAQRALVGAVRAGVEPEQTLAGRAKGRSKHNTYMVVPTVFIMISNHYPTLTYGADQAWLVLAVLVLVGWIAARIVYHSSI
jgi:uncharacterized membrane protein